MRRLGVLGASVVGVFTAVACGGDDGDDDSGFSGAANGPPTSQGTGSTGAGGSTGVGGGAAASTGAGATTPPPEQVLHPWTESTFDACQAEIQRPEPYNVVLMFVVDVSGSMTQGAPGTNMTKWDATKQALSQVIQDLPPSVAMGIVSYPNMDPPPVEHKQPTGELSECVNTEALVAPQLMDDAHRRNLEDSLNSVYVAGGTPTHSAYTVGLEALKAATGVTGNRYMLLITDGEPTYGVGCIGNGTTLSANMDPAYITDTVAAIRDAGDRDVTFPPIGTFVIGSPGSEENYSGQDARPWLSDAAIAGGTGPIGCSSTGVPTFCHFDLTSANTNFAANLNNALAQILGQVVACEYSRPADPTGQEIDPELVDIKFVAGDDREYRVPALTRAEECGTGSQGWFWAPDGRISLCLATCGLVRADALAGIEVAYGCKPYLI